MFSSEQSPVFLYNDHRKKGCWTDAFKWPKYKKIFGIIKKKKEAEENKINGLLSWSPLGRYLIWWGQWLFRIFLICAFLHFVKE